MLGPIEVLRRITNTLDALNIDYFLVGSLASMYYSRPRFTNDIDLVLQIHANQVLDFEKAFSSQLYYCPPLEILIDEINRRGSFNLIHHESGIKIDVVLTKLTEFSKSEFGRRTKIELVPGYETYIATPEDIIIKKLDYYREGGSEKHIADIREILSSTSVDADYLEAWCKNLGLQEHFAKAK